MWYLALKNKNTDINGTDLFFVVHPVTFFCTTLLNIFLEYQDECEHNSKDVEKS